MKRLFAAAAVAPLCFAASGAYADTSISDDITTPVVTSTAGNVTVTADGFVLVNSGAAVTIDSSNTLTNQGAVVVRDAPTGSGVLVNVPAGGLTSGVTINGLLAADDTDVDVDTDSDGDLDGSFASLTAERYGLRLTGPGVFTGNITFGTGSELAIKGSNGTAGVLVDSAMVGDLKLNGNSLILGTDSFGLHLTKPFTGDITSSGVLGVQGERGIGIAVDGPVTGQLKIDGTVQVTGYRFTTRPSTVEARNKLDADDLLQGGPAVRIRGSLSEGFLIYAPPVDLLPVDKDEDKDGIEDENQTGIGTIIQYGGAPAVLVGDTGNITLGEVGVGPYNNYGIVVRGDVVSAGVYDGISATGIQIGGLGGSVNISSGINLRGGLNASSYFADATGLRLGSGANVPLIRNGGRIFVSGVSQATGAVPQMTGIDIQAGATAPVFENLSTLAVAVSGPTGTATAVRDRSGTLTSILNTSIISAQAITDTGANEVTRANAFDLTANTTGVTLTQKNDLEGAVPSINGNILFGSGADLMDVQKGLVVGDVSFGAGADTFRLDGGSTYLGTLSKGGGTLAINVEDGVFSLSNKSVFNATSLNLGSESNLLFSADPGNADPTQRNNGLKLTGAAVLESGSKISLTFVSKLVAPTSYKVIEAGSVTTTGGGASLVGGSPFVYTTSLSTTATSVSVDVRQKTLEEMGLSGGRAAAFGAFYDIFDSNTAVRDAVFAKTSKAGFDGLYNQFLPDYSGGIFQSLALGARGVMQAQAEGAGDMPVDEPRSWLQEIGSGVSQKSATEVGYHANGFGIAGGYETPFGANGATAGISAAVLSSEVRNRDRLDGTVLSVGSVMIGGYWRDRIGGFMLDAGVNGGYAWIDSDRRIVNQTATGARTLDTVASADWSGVIASARFGASYNYDFGVFYLRPEAALDYIYLSESGYTETGGVASVNLQVDKRSSYEAAAEAGVTMGAKFGRTFRWGPELRVAYRSTLAGGLSDTTARFVALPGQPFVLPSIQPDEGRMILRAALRGGSAYTNIALEATGEYGDFYRAYMARFIVRFLF